MLISDWSSDVCSSDLVHVLGDRVAGLAAGLDPGLEQRVAAGAGGDLQRPVAAAVGIRSALVGLGLAEVGQHLAVVPAGKPALRPAVVVARMAAHVGHAVDRGGAAEDAPARSEEHTSELQSLMRISYAVFCLKNKKIHTLLHITDNVS